MQFTIKQGMNQETLKQYPDNYFDSIVTDPPYGIEFLGKDWDSNTGAVETWEQCFRVLKPGGHMLAFSAARTYHHLATNIESVGFEIRDQLMWIYASGFPKAQDIGKAIQKRQGVQETKAHKHNVPRIGGAVEVPQAKANIVATSPEAQAWSGWKTALKPAHEPIVMARKPFKGSCIDNVLEHGVGALNIDATRIGDEVLTYDSNIEKGMYNGAGYKYGANADKTANNIPTQTQGRFPSNVFGEIPDYQKYFYCPKVSRAERHCGFESVPQPEKFNNPDEMKKHPLWDPSIGTNSHRLMQKIRAHNKGSLDHIPSAGTTKMYGPEQAVTRNTANLGGDKKGKNAKGSLDHIEPFFENKDSKANNSPTVLRKRDEKNLNHTQTGTLGRMKDAMHNSPTVGNNHPTVKPVALMSYLVKLVTPEGGKVLDPFNGSGSTGMACVEHGFDYTGCELDPAYVEIATKRINGWYNKTLPDNNFNELFEGEKQ